MMKSTKTKATKKAAKPDLDLENQLDDIAQTHPRGYDALNIYTLLSDLPRFLQEAITDALTLASDALNLPDTGREPDPAKSFQMLVDLFEAAGDKFTLTPDHLKHKTQEMIAALEDSTMGADSPRMKAATEYGDMLHAAVNRGRCLDLRYVRRMLPVVLEINQEMKEIDAFQRRSDAAVRGAETRKRNAQKKGGAKK
jgi:hypothetical protein